MLDPPAIMTYASVVGRETVRIALTMAALNDLEVKCSDIKGAYLTAPCEEKVWTRLGPEFGPDAGKKALVVRALYGLKSAGASFSRHLSDCMRHLGYSPCKADPNLWMKRAVRPDDGLDYWMYVLLYVNDCMAISHNAEAELHKIDKYFPMKKCSIGEPDLYLGSKLRKVTLENGVEAWSMSPSKYVQEAVRKMDEYSQQRGTPLSKCKAKTSWPKDYSAELDSSNELDNNAASQYQTMIGVLHWMVELGRVDVITEVSLLASHLAAPREGHMDTALHLFAYLKGRHNARMVFDPSYPDIDMSKFKTCDWKHFYGDVQEAVPLDAPKALGKEIDLRLFVDSDHAGDKRTRRSRTGYFIFLNNAPVIWLSKKQPTLETAVFGAEFVAMKNGVERLRGLRYKLRMMGIPVNGPSYVFGDNMSVIHNTQTPESTLKKKSNQICYHFVHEAVASGEITTGHIDTTENVGGLATKVITSAPKREYLVDKVLHDIYERHWHLLSGKGLLRFPGLDDQIRLVMGQDNPTSSVELAI